MVTFRRIFCAVFGCLVLCAGVFCAFLPLPRIVSVAEERYVCTWEDGRVSEETYASAYAMLDPAGGLSLVSGDRRGTIAASSAYSALCNTLESGGIAELLAADCNGLSRLECAAAYRKYRNELWFAEGFFAWDGRSVEREDAPAGSSVVWLSGKLGAGALKRTGAERLELCAEAEFTARSLIGTAVREITAHAPYVREGDAVYLDTGTARRLIAGMPAAETLTVGDADYIDEGALCACENLVSLSLPFAGASAQRGGMLAYLFSDGVQFRVPSLLKSLKVRGGVLEQNALYRLNGLETIDLCGMDSVAWRAVENCTALNVLHVPAAVKLPQGNFSSRRAACGCTVYERLG
jgi:hypothetical protein